MNLKAVRKIAHTLSKTGMPKEIARYLHEKANTMLLDEKSDREEFQRSLEHFSDDELMAFVPDVYQKDIYQIDYARLKENGIRLLSFDIDDTIDDSFINKLEANAPMLTVTMPDKARKLVRSLKDMGFTVVLLTNAQKELAEGARKDLDADYCVARARKPETSGFETIASKYGVDKSQMAHIGNSMRADIAGGNKYGVTTCLVRRAGTSMKLVKFVSKTLGVPTKGHLIREKLLERGLWRKHHVCRPGDQYYQLGEVPEYRRQASPADKPEAETGSDIAQQAANDLIQQVNADKDTVYTLDELLRNAYKANESSGMKTLRTHLGDNIVFTGVWADAREERELEQEELLDGELSGYIFTIGGYTIRCAVCLYQDDDEVNYTQRVPAGQDAAAQYKQEGWRTFGLRSGVRDVQAISARYNGAGSEDWQLVCIAATSVRWDESIDFIGTLKPSASAPDEQEVLFVLKQYTGDSFGVAHWYKLSSDGTVAEYEEHPFNPESSEKSWKD